METTVTASSTSEKVSIKELHSRIGHHGLENIKNILAITDGVSLKDDTETFDTPYTPF